MFHIRRIYDDVLPVNKEAIEQVKAILRERFSALDEAEIEGLGEQLRNPFKKRFQTVLYVAEKRDRRVQGFAIVLYEPELRFSYLEFIATPKRLTSRGIGGVLYEWVREEAAAVGSQGLFFECLPDD
ncbi:MAG: hypothetical protein KC466_16735, partial [Myxococcales bacterium]|nr:hypothetical protein [Myxococcales bacterium]